MTKRLLTNSLIFFIGNLILSVFNYLYNTFMGRFLGPADYGVIGSLLAFISIITIPTNAVGTVAMRFASRYHAQNDDSAINGFLRALTKRLGLVGSGVAIILVLASVYLKNYLKLPSALPVILIAPIVILFILLPLNRGILQGLQRFTASIINQSVDPLFKLILGVLLVKLGFGVNGAIIAILLASALGYLTSFIPLNSIFKTKSTPLKVLPKEVKDYSGIALIAFLMATILMNIDILLVKHFLPADQAGLYTALSSLGKIILFVTSPVIGVMFPMIADLQGRKEKHYQILMLSFLLVALIGIGSTVVYYLFPQFVISILYGQAYISVAPLLGLFGLTMLLYSLINLWVNYFLSIGNKAFLFFLGLSVIAEIGLLVVRHQSFVGVTTSLLIAMIFGFVSLTGYYLYLKRRQIIELIPGHYLGANPQ